MGRPVTFLGGFVVAMAAGRTEVQRAEGGGGRSQNLVKVDCNRASRLVFTEVLVEKGCGRPQSTTASVGGEIGSVRLYRTQRFGLQQCRWSKLVRDVRRDADLVRKHDCSNRVERVLRHLFCTCCNFRFSLFC